MRSPRRRVRTAEGGRVAAPGHGDGLAGWSRLHGGLDPAGNRLVLVWVRAAQRVARVPAVARLGPDAITAAGVLAAGAAVGAAAAGGRGAAAAAFALVLLSSVLDALDGAVAVVTGRASRRGAVLDAVADRVSDLLLAGVLLALGAPVPWVAAAAALAQLHEYLRARAVGEGMAGVGALTVAERPTRVVLVALACLGAAVLPAGAPVAGWPWATTAVVAWLAVGVVGAGQLVAGVRSGLREDPPPT